MLPKLGRLSCLEATDGLFLQNVTSPHDQVFGCTGLAQTTDHAMYSLPKLLGPLNLVAI